MNEELNKVPTKLNYKEVAIGAYAVIGILVTLYEWLFGSNAYKGLGYALGQGVVWPAVLFPGVGKAIGGLVWIVVVIVLFLFVKTKK
jgi:hypothetical protein